MKTIRILSSLFIALTLAAAARADDPAFLIEAIRVEGIRYSSPAIVVAESKLVEGRSYTETQIRDAVRRVHRLPFVIDTDVRLEKGSERNRYVLVIRVEETKPLFLNYRSFHQRIARTESELYRINPMTGERERRPSLMRFDRDFPNVGGRVFVGSRSMFAASADLAGGEPCCEGENQYSLAFTQYDLFGTRSSLAAVVQYTEYSLDFSAFDWIGGRKTTSFGDHISWGLTGVVPLFGNNAISASWHRRQEQRLVNPGGKDQIVRRGLDQPQIAWVYDSTNDLLFPTSGTYGNVSANFARDSPLVLETPGFPQNAVAEYHWHHVYNGILQKFFEVTPRQSLSAGATALRVPGSQYWSASVNGGYTAVVWNSRAGGYNDLRLRINGALFRAKNDTQSGQVLAGVAFRSVWGVIRFDFEYDGWRRPQ